MTEIRCPRCGSARWEVLGKLILGEKLFLAYHPDTQPEPCRKCGYVFTYQPEQQAA